MKAAIPFFFVMLSSLFPQEPRLSGTFKAVFDAKYAQTGYQITFNDSTYVRRMPDAVTSRGAIKYEKFRAIIRKNTDEDALEIDKREFGKDTMVFTTRSKRDLSKVVNRGRFIRVR